MEMRTRVARPGFSLVEMLVVMVVGVIALTAVYRTLIMQHRSYRHEGARISTQQAARTTVQVLAAELREISASGDDLLMVAPESLTVRVPRKLGIACAVNAASDQITVWQLSEDMPFVKGDSVIVFVEDNPTSSSDDRWARGKVSTTPSSASGCTTWRPAVVLGFESGGPDDEPVNQGAPVRGFVHLTYGIYRIDGEWVFGRHSDNVSDVVVLVGPLASPPNGGLEFTYFATSGADITPAPGNVNTNLVDLNTVERIRISAAARSRGPVNPDDTHYLDSLSLQQYLRNN